ncbi:unnamed protein product [Cylindrotheca closterium]|uniref:J domain-containing protein n=1 Tax=Cylindrotheca closterium TaxID=2856 RepID=A0AAD2FEF7_9STRA|nr:unnamed protein product [Cylindrotheca closterium]
MMDNPYQVLGLPLDASESDIKKAYHKAALKYHPDRQTNKENEQDAGVRFAEISEAYETLTDPVKRYDWRQKHENGGSGTTSTKPARAPASPSRNAAPPSTTSSTSSTSYQYSNPVSNSSKRAEFMAKKQESESTRASFASPVSLRRKRQSYAAAPPPSPMQSTPRASVRPSIRRPSSSSPSSSNSNSNWSNKQRMASPDSNSINMTGSVRSLNAGTLRAKNNSRVPQSAGATSQRRTVGRMSMQMPQPPLSAGAGTHKRRASVATPSQTRHVPQGPLPTVSTSRGLVLRQSVRLKPSAQPSPAPRGNLPAAPRGNMPAPPLSSPAVRRNSLDGSGRKKSHRDTSLDGSSRKVRREKTSSKKSTDMVVKRPKSQPPPRKSIFGINVGKKKVHNNANDDKSMKSNKSKKKKEEKDGKKKKKKPKSLSAPQQTLLTTTTTTTTKMKKKRT